MKKRRVVFALVLAALALFSCRSAPRAQEGDAVEEPRPKKPEPREVKPLDLLDGSSSFYLRVPKSADDELLRRMLVCAIDSVDEDSAKMIVDRIDTVFIGLERNRKQTLMQAALSARVPQKMAAASIKKSGAWSVLSLKAGGEDFPRDYEYYSLLKDGTQLAIPSGGIVCVAPNVSAMLLDYDAHAYDGCDAHRVSDEVYAWLDGAPPDEIRFYAARPQSFLTILTGATLNFKFLYVRGTMRSDPKRDAQYLMSIEFEFADERTVRAATAALSLSFGLTNADVSFDTSTHLVISGIRIAKKQLYKLFAL